MDRNNYFLGIDEVDRNKLTKLLTEELPVLRAKIGVSQGEISSIIGVSRQTYSAIENKKRVMSWNVFLSLILFFEHNQATKDSLINAGIFPKSLQRMLNVNNRDG